MKLKKSIICTMIAATSAISCQSLYALNPTQELPAKAVTLQGAPTPVKDIATYAMSALSKVTPFPFDTIIDIAAMFIPSASSTAEIETETDTYKLLEAVNAKLDSQLNLSQQTINDISTLSNKMMTNYFNDKTLAQDEIIQQVENRYEAFYTNKVFPKASDEFYSYAASVCQDGTCTDAEANIIKLMNGNPVYANNQQANTLQAEQTLNLYQLEQSYEKSLSADKNWESLQTAIEKLLAEDDKNESEKMVNYYAASEAVFTLQADYISAYTKLYYILSMQLAFYYAHPEFFKTGDSSQMLPVFDGVTETGEAGYQQALANLDTYFTKNIGDDKYKKVFGGEIKDEETGGTITESGYLHLISPRDYTNQYLESKTGHSNVLEENPLCQPVSLIMDNATDGKKVGRLTSRCQTDNFDNDEKKPTSYNMKGIDIPYEVDSSGNMSNMGYIEITYDETKKAFVATPAEGAYEGSTEDMGYIGYYGLVNNGDREIMKIIGDGSLYMLDPDKGAYATVGTILERNGKVVTGELITSTYGWDFKIIYDDILFVGNATEQPDYGVENFLLTQNGHLVGLSIKSIDMGLSRVRYFCPNANDEGNASCTMVKGREGLVWTDGTKVTGDADNIWLHDDGDYNKFTMVPLLFSSTPEFTAPQAYLLWQEDEPSFRKKYTNKLFLDGTVNYDFSKITKDTVILTSDNGEYRLIYKVPADGGSGRIEIEYKRGDGWVLTSSEYVVSTDALFNGNLTKAEFSGGDIKLYTAADKDEPIWSLQDQYKTNEKIWYADPYAYVELQDDGALVVYGSEYNGQEIWNSAEDMWSKVGTDVKGDYVNSCSNIKWSYPNLSATCDGSSTTLNYIKDCESATMVSSVNGQLTCDEPRTTLLPTNDEKNDNRHDDGKYR